MNTNTETIEKHDGPPPAEKTEPIGLKVKMTVYRGALVIETINPTADHPDFTPSGGTRFGCVLNDTKKNLGLSKEAHDWLKKVRPRHDAIGDLMWFDTGGNKRAIGWLGGPLRILDDPAKAEGDRDYKVSGDFVEIPNEVPVGARGVIDESTPDDEG